jgi:3-oxoadipate enol-lactonase
MEFIAANKITLCTKREGSPDEQAVVFINSLGSDFRIWDEVLPRLGGQYSFIRYDLRGHGLSDCPEAPYTIRDHVDDLSALLTALSVQKPILVGISVGGLIAMDFAATFPDAARALVLMDTFVMIGTETMWNERINTLREHGMAHLGGAILARWFAPSFREAHPLAWQGYYNMLTRMPVMGYTGTCEAIRDADLAASARTIDCPALVLCGAEDASTPPDLVRDLVDILPDARYSEISCAGHLPCVENPAETAAEIRAFMKEVL